ncbi:MAG: pseudaminic acid synthase [Anaerohalosphaeraceae bacterium]|nr:pseudaminic acid synthase [Anaerohalosphaeraceae bacterium]
MEKSEKIEIRIGSKKVSQAGPAFIIAEVSANHNGSFEDAVEIIRAAAVAGADAVKLQTYTADTMTLNCDNEYFRIQHGTLWDGKTLYELYQQGTMPWEWQPRLKKAAEELGLILFSSPFDKTAVDFLEEMGVAAYKVASFEITDVGLIEYIASKKKPVIISTGIAELAEIQDAIDACHKVGNDDVILLKCTSAYPTKTEDMNLRVMVDMAGRFSTLVGLSDHSLDMMLPAVAVAVGGVVIEKHFTLDRKNGGLDSAFSLEPTEFKSMVDNIRKTEAAMGEVDYKLTENAKASRKFGRSLFAAEDIKAGDVFTEKNIRSVRPSDGLLPRHLPDILGKAATQDVPFGSPIDWDMVKGGSNE